MDKYSDRVPVRTIGSGTRYDGKVWYESLSSICSINGTPARNVEKSMLAAGDQVTIMFQSKIYRGVVDPTGESAGQAGNTSPASLTTPPLLQWESGTRGGPTQDNDPRQEKLIARQEPTQDKQPRQEKPRAKQEPTQEPPCQELSKKETSSRTSPRKPKPKKRPRDHSESPPRVTGNKKRLVPKKEGEMSLLVLRCLCITYMYSFICTCICTCKIDT